MSSRRTFDKAVELQRQGKTDEALTLVRLALRRDEDPNLLAVMGVLLIGSKQYTQAEHFLKRSLERRPGDAETLANLGSVLVLQSKQEEAAETLRKAVAAGPLEEGPRLTLIGTLDGLGRLAESADVARAGLEIHPSSARLLGRYGRVLHSMGRVEQALEVLRRAAALEPFDAGLADQLCAAMTYVPGVSPEEVISTFKRYGFLVEREAGAPFTWDRAQLAARRRPGEPIRVGLLSPDLRRHAVATFIEPFLKHADRSRVTILCYSAGREDEVSAHLRRLADGWRHVKDQEPRETAALINGDGVDVLIDLAGHTGANRMGTLALRPAPLQMTYLGFPSTTGLPAVDWRIVDSISDPPGSEPQSTERLARMDPCFLTYQPAAPLPAVSELPMLATGAPTFASYSSLLKLNERLIRVWARVLGAVPRSRLILKHIGLKDPEVRRDVTARLEAAGAPAGSVLCEPPEPSIQEVLPLYNRVDIALDTFPFNGATTLCDVLVMGVPAVGLRGSTSAARVGLSILTAVGLMELCASDEEGYVRAAVDLSQDVERLRALRSGLRERFLASEVCNATGGAARLTDIIRSAWEDCVGRPRAPVAP
jgi:Tfp pilus assembly protein PilF